MTPRSLLLVAVALSPTLARGQAAPAASTPLPTTNLNLGLVNGTFHYGVSAAEIFQTGYGSNGGVTESTSLSGSLIYSTKSLRAPSSVIYSGGVQIYNNSGFGTSVFQSLALTQGYLTRNWTFGISDVVSYLPQSPTTGLSGIPGTGDIGLNPVTSVDAPAQSILTYGSNRVSNFTTGNVARHLTAHTSASADASYGILHYFNDLSLDTRQVGADLGLNYEISPRSSVGVNANYSIFSYQNLVLATGPGGDASFTTRSLFARGQHQFTRALSAYISVGPQWVNSSANLGIPSSLNVAGNVGVSYARRFGTLNAFYTRGANGGSGVLPGARSDSLGASFSRAYGHNWALSADIGYARTAGLGSGVNLQVAALPGIGSYGGFDSTFAGAQATRRLTDSISTYASYTASNQTYGNVRNTPGAINGLVQYFSIGISYYPRSVNLGQF